MKTIQAAAFSFFLSGILWMLVCDALLKFDAQADAEIIGIMRRTISAEDKTIDIQRNTIDICLGTKRPGGE